MKRGITLLIPIGTVCVACRDGVPIAYMNIKLAAEVDVL